MAIRFRVLLMALLCFALSAHSQSRISSPTYFSPNFDLIHNHKKIAILPYESYMQKQFFLEAANRIRKGKIEIALQSFSQTNELLLTAGIENQKIEAAELRAILEVDGFLIIDALYVPSKGGSDAIMTVTGSIYDSKTTEMLWQKSYEIHTAYQSGLIIRQEPMIQRGIKDLLKVLPY